MKIRDIEIDQDFIVGMAEDLGETVEQFTETAVADRALKIIEDKVTEQMEKLCAELHKRGYNVNETLPKFVDFTPVFAALSVDVEDREQNITKAIELSLVS